MLIRTYLQDGNTSPYPFMEHGDTPPFPYSCIYAIGVCAVPIFGVGTRVVATSAQLSADAVSLTLAWLSSTGESRCMCTLTAKPREYGRASEPSLFSAWICVGAVPVSVTGTYSGTWQIDPTCIRLVQGHGTETRISTALDGSCPLPDSLRVTASGLLKLSMLPRGATVEGAPAGLSRIAVLHTDIPDDAVTVAGAYNAAAYSTISTINGMQAGDDGELSIEVVDDNGDRATQRSRSFVTFDVDRIPNADGKTAMFKTERMDGSPQPDSSVVLITVNGHKNLPNCYARDQDEALD